jgi:hypothetical protein
MEPLWIKKYWYWCPEYQSRQVKRNGHQIIRELDVQREQRVLIQRFVCKCCGASYSIRSRRRRRPRYSRAFEEEIVRRYVEWRDSYQVISQGVYERTGRKILASSSQRMILDNLLGFDYSTIGAKRGNHSTLNRIIQSMEKTRVCFPLGRGRNDQ